MLGFPIFLSSSLSPSPNSVQFSRSVVSDSLQPRGQQQARLPCPSPTPRAYSNPCPSSRWCHSTVSSILCHPLCLPPSIFPSIRVFSSESLLHIRWPKYRSFSFNISPSSEHSGLISFRMDWLNLLAIQGTLKSHVRPETIKLLEDNIGKTLCDINHSRILYDPPPRILEIKAKINKWDLIKIKSFCTTKEL